MTSVLSCLVATIALAADPGPKGLPFGVPPAPDDAVIARVAPPQCLFYVNWAGTASPSASSSSETEKLLAEPEVQEFFRGMNKVIRAYLRKQDETPRRRRPQVATTESTAAPGRIDADATIAPSPEAGNGHKLHVRPATPVLTPLCCEPSGHSRPNAAPSCPFRRRNT